MKNIKDWNFVFVVNQNKDLITLIYFVVSFTISIKVVNNFARSWGTKIQNKHGID